MDYDTYMMLKAYKEELDCACAVECDLCDVEECDCGWHQKDCATCDTKRGCRCDEIYDTWREG